MATDDYLDYLNSDKWEEGDIVPLVTPKNKVSFHQNILEILPLVNRLTSNESDSLIEAIKSLNENANLLLKKLNHDFVERCRAANVEIYDNIFIGIVPRNIFNCRSRKSKNGYLILADNNFFQVLEIACGIFVSGDPGGPHTLGQLVAHYCESNELLDPEQFAGQESSPGKYGLVVALTSTSEDFAIAHEHGHITLGHYDGNSHLDPFRRELEADMWACRALLRHCQMSGGGCELPEEELHITGLFIFLSMGALVESYKAEQARLAGTPWENSHPPAVERLLRAWLYLGMYDLGNSTQIGQKFLTLASAAMQILLGRPLELNRSIVDDLAHNLAFRFVDSFQPTPVAGDPRADLELLDRFLDSARAKGLLPAAGAPWEAEYGEQIDELLDLFEEIRVATNSSAAD